MMNKLTVLTLFVSCFFFSAFANAQVNKPGEKSFRVLMIGNSFSGNASKYLPAIARSGKHELVLDRAEMGGCSLQRHWDSVVVNMADSLRGRAYQGKSLRQMLMNVKYDAISLQQYSMLSPDSTTYQPYAKYLYDLIKKYQPQAKLLVHETWPYRQDAKVFGKTSSKHNAQSQEEMYINLRKAYSKLAQDLSAKIIPSGDAFFKAGNDKDWGFKKDLRFEADNAIYPTLPTDLNSLHIGYYWDDQHKLKFDANHANDIGCYLAGLVWYAVLFNKDPSSVNFKPDAINSHHAEYLKKVAFEVTHRKAYR